MAYSAIVVGLSPGATYYYCAIAENGYGKSFGSVVSFVAGAAAPIVTTEAASDVLATTATIPGTANPNGTPTTAPNRVYYCCAAASNSGGAAFGNVLSFTTADSGDAGADANDADTDGGLSGDAGTGWSMWPAQSVDPSLGPASMGLWQSELGSCAQRLPIIPERLPSNDHNRSWSINGGRERAWYG